MLSKPAQGVLRWAMEYYSARWFTERARDRHDLKLRKHLLRRFHIIDKQRVSLHGKKEFLFMVDFLLEKAPSGPLLECGCFRGGSTAKLSLVAGILEKKLYVCDSFQGLPEPIKGVDGSFTNISGSRYQFSAGEYSATFDAVTGFVRQFGRIECCEFVRGFFADSLPQLSIDPGPGFVFMDVDLISSARDCLKSLWPKLQVGGRIFTHEAHYIEYVRGITAAEFWNDLGCAPPLLFGAGFGCGPGAGSIAYFEKPGGNY